MKRYPWCPYCRYYVVRHEWRRHRRTFVHMFFHVIREPKERAEL